MTMDGVRDCGYENFPLKIVKIRAGIAGAILVTGTIATGTLNVFFGVLYLLYSIIIVLRIAAAVCNKCYYHGKWCDSGLGKLSGLISSRGSVSAFAGKARKTTLFLVAMVLFPLLCGFAAVFSDFSVLALFGFLGFIASLGAFIYTNSKMACVNCKMAGICPFSMVMV